MEDSGLRLIYDCRLTIVDLRSAPILAAPEHAVQDVPTHSRCSGQALKVGATSASETGRWPLEMLKMKVDPAMCMKTQETMTKWPTIKQVFARKCTHCARINKNL
jgi:hypothetical protein